VGVCRERLWGNGIVIAGILQLTVASFVTVKVSEQPVKKKKKSIVPIGNLQLVVLSFVTVNSQ